MLIQFLVSFLPLFLIARAVLGKFVPAPNPRPMEADREEAKGAKGPFRLLDLPPELVLRIVHLLDESTTRPPVLGSNDSASRLAVPQVSCGRRATVNALAQTCRDLHGLCRPLFRRWLVIRTTLPRVPSASDLANVPDSADLLDRLPVGLRRPIENTLVRLETAALAPSSTTAFWYHGPSRIELYDRVLWSLEHLTPLAGSLRSAVVALSNLTYLHLEGVSDRLASDCLSVAPPTLQAVSLSYILAAGPTPASDLVIPSLPNLLALKLFECPQEWLQLVAPATRLQHLVIWLPSDGFLSMDWLPIGHLDSIVTLNLDGFRYRPKLLIVLCDMIKEHAANHLNAPMPLRDLDIEATFTFDGPNKLLEHLLSALALCPSLTWLAVSCIPRRIISPSIIEAIADVLGDRLEFLLVMVEDYRRRVWRGELAGYAHAMRKFSRLSTFAFNHSFPTNTDALSQLEPFIPPLQTFLPALGFENVDELLAHLESEDESDDDEAEGVGGARRRHLARMHRAMVSQSGVFFGPEAPARSLRRVVQVTALFANQAQGNIVTCRDGGSRDFQLHFRPRADLERLLLPFDFRWAKV